jgi:sulfite reductase (NADPH) hemoprotein beta-component
MPNWLITANRLKDGVAVWLGSNDNWVDRIENAAVFDNERLAESLQSARTGKSQNVVVEVRDVEVGTSAGSPVSVERREQLRSAGPSVRGDLAKGQSGARWAEPPFPEPPSATSRSPYAGIYRYDEYDGQFLRDRAEQFRQQVRRRLAGELSEDEFKPLRLMNGLYLQLHGYMLRVALPYGVTP